MSIKRSLATVAAAALASMALAPSALAAEDGTIVEINASDYQGWAKFNIPGVGSYECHVTAKSEITGDTGGKVLQFTVPDTTKCTGTGVIEGCKLSSHSSNTPTFTATPTDFDVTSVEITNTFSGCSTTNVTLTFSSITLRPLKTGARAVTNTDSNLGETAQPGEPIAGVEISGSGTIHSEQHIIFVPTTRNLEVTASGELEITGEDRCTYTLQA